jgi:3-oxoadipate enol-lactonase
MPERISPLPPGDWVELTGRGRAWVWDTGAGDAAGTGRERPTVVLLHGWSSTAALNWSRCFRPLSETYRVVAMDHRGHGRGIRSMRPFTLEDCADDVAALIESLGVGPAVVAGYSMGGPVAQLLWRRHPEVVRGVILCATAASFGPAPLPPVAMQALGLGLSMALTAVPAGVLQEGMRWLTRGRGPVEAVAPWAVAEFDTGDPVAFIQAAAALAAFDATGWIAELDRPTAVIVTTEDRTISPARQWWLARAIPDADIHTVGADHRACVEAADEFVPALIDACRHAAAA